jgi:Protein of unknown function (DUF295)
VNELNSSLVFDSPKSGLELNCDYLVELVGSLLRILQYYDQSTSSSYQVSLYRLEFENGNDHCKARWVEISIIDDQILLLSRGRGLSMSANGFHGYEGNCIYFFGTIFSNFLVCCYNIKDGTMDVMPCHLERGSTWSVFVLESAELPQN